MCGRFINISNKNYTQKIFQINKINNFSKTSYNISPQQNVNVIFSNKGALTLDSLKWGYSFFNNQTKKNQLVINSRLETIDSKFLFKDSYLKRKCIILSNGYIEWKNENHEKLPYFINIPEMEPIYFAGIWRLEKINNKSIAVCCILTKQANNKIKDIHDRMPVLFSYREAISYLNDNKNNYSKFFIESEIEEDLDFFRISKKINNPNNNVKEFLFPLNKNMAII